MSPDSHLLFNYLPINGVEVNAIDWPTCSKSSNAKTSYRLRLGAIYERHDLVILHLFFRVVIFPVTLDGPFDINVGAAPT